MTIGLVPQDQVTVGLVTQDQISDCWLGPSGSSDCWPGPTGLNDCWLGPSGSSGCWPGPSGSNDCWLGPTGLSEHQVTVGLDPSGSAAVGLVPQDQWHSAIARLACSLPTDCDCEVGTPPCIQGTVDFSSQAVLHGHSTLLLCCLPTNSHNRPQQMSDCGSSGFGFEPCLTVECMRGPVLWLLYTQKLS